MIGHSDHKSGFWDRPRGWQWVASIFLLQVILVLVFSSRTPLSVAPANQRGRVRLLPEPVTPSDLESQVWVDDPAEVALVSVRGFSGPTWRRLPRLEGGSRYWADPPQWLTQDPNRLAAAKSLSTSQPVPSPLAAVPLPEPFAGAAATPKPSTPLPSAARVEGELARRKRIDAPELPSWTHHDVLAPTTVELMVDRDGGVLAATLLTRSGLPAADEHALALARAARFEPVASEPGAPLLTWGQLVFQWQVLPPGTNAP